MKPKKDKALVEQADGHSCGHRGSYHKFLKKIKNRKERHKAKRNPEATPTYSKYRGYET